MRRSLVHTPSRSGGHVEFAHEIRNNDIDRVSQIIPSEIRNGMATVRGGARGAWKIQPQYIVDRGVCDQPAILMGRPV